MKISDKSSMTSPFTIQINTPSIILRQWTAADIESLVRSADNPRVSACMRDAFPSPYTREDASRFISTVACGKENLIFAIQYGDEAVGSIGIHPLGDVYSRTAEIGYWLGEPFWGRGIVTAAVQAIVPVAFRQFEIERLQAGVFSNNPASMRVLEKCGFFRETIHRNATFKRGKLLDEVMYVRFRDGDTNSSAVEKRD
jgi:RimJ/RimL family protein N-acetyltransferase